MKKKIKNLIIIFASCIVFHSLKYNTVFAAENDLSKTNAETSNLKITSSVDYNEKGDIKDFNDLENAPKYISANVYSDATLASVTITKVWKIKFDQELDVNTVKNNVKIIDKNTKEELKSSIEFQDNNKTLSVSSTYAPNKTYTLVINKNVKSKSNSHLDNVVSKDFITDKEVKPTISSIEDVNVTIKQKEKFELPSTVNANMSNGKTDKVSVTWDKPIKDTDAAGNYVFYGSISGYDKKVKLDLTIKSTENINNNNTNNNSSNNSQDNNQNNSISNVNSNGASNENSNNETSTTNNETIDLEPHSTLHKTLHDYLMNEDNRQSVMKRAIELHGGELSNNCVYFASEALRRSGIDNLPESVCNTVQLTNKLKGMGWSTSTDFSNLRPGDICFTKSYGWGPTHTFVFMKWVNPGKYDYAYICDNQGNEYDNQIYHKRNVNFATETKDPTVYFMYKP